MKILYLYHEYGGRYEKYGELMERLGHEVHYFHMSKGKTKSDQLYLKHVKKCNPDMVFFLSPFYIEHGGVTREAYDYLKNKKIPLVIYSTIRTQISYEEDLEAWKHYDYAFVNHRGHASFLKDNGVNAFYIPLAFYQEQYYPEVLPNRYNVSFMGSTQTTVPVENDRRVKCCKALDEFGIKVFGARFNQRGIPAITFSNHKEQRDVYNMSKVNLDLPYINSSLKFYENIYHLKNRFFEIPACNAFMVTARYPDFEEMLDDTMVGYYDGNSIDSLKEVVSKYLRDEHQRKQMSARAYEETVSKHTYWHRMQDIFNILDV